MNDNQEHDVSNVAILNVTDITIVKHIGLPNNDQREIVLDENQLL